MNQLAYGDDLGEHDSERYLRHLSESEDQTVPQLQQELAFVHEFLASLESAPTLMSESPASCRQRGTHWTDGPLVDPIDWDQVGETLATGGSGGTWVARMALELTIGQQRFRDAVDWCVDDKPGAELARLVLADVQPPSAGDRCIEIFRFEVDLKRRQTAVSVLCLVVVNSQLYIVEELLNDSDPTIQESGAVILESLVESQLRSDPDPEPYVVLAEMHPNERVREKAQTIRRDWVDWP